MGNFDYEYDVTFCPNINRNVEITITSMIHLSNKPDRPRIDKKITEMHECNHSQNCGVGLNLKECPLYPKYKRS